MRIVSLASCLVAVVFALAELMAQTGQKTASMKLAKAVAIAEQTGKGEAIKAKRHDKAEAVEYHVELLGADGHKIKIRLDAAGKQLVEEKKDDKKDPKKESKKDQPAPAAGKIKLTEAIAIAERLGSGDAIKADYHAKGEFQEFHIEVLTREDAKVKIHLDPRGKRIEKTESPAKGTDKK